MKVALTRGVSPAFADAERTYARREPIDVARAVEQHGRYEEALRDAGCEVRRIAADAASPDCVFIEDTAVVLPELAVLTRLGALSRRGEVGPVAEALAAFRAVERIEAPARLDGGDVLVVDRTVYVGASSRSDGAGAESLTRILEPYGYRVVPVQVRGCLHLKSAVTLVAELTVLVCAAFVDRHAFVGLRRIEVDPDEPHGANALRVDKVVVVPAHAPRTRRRLEESGIETVAVDVSEIAKAEGGVTCCSLVFDRTAGRGIVST